MLRVPTLSTPLLVWWLGAGAGGVAGAPQAAPRRPQLAPGPRAKGGARRRELRHMRPDTKYTGMDGKTPQAPGPESEFIVTPKFLGGVQAGGEQIEGTFQKVNGPTM